MTSPFRHPQAGDLVTPPKYAVRASYTANIANLAAATTTCDTAVTLVEGDVVLLTEQVTASENGLYVVGAVASGVAPLTRFEMCKSAAGMPPGTQVFISEGTARGNLVYQLTTNAPIVVGTTSLTFAAITQVAAAPVISDYTNAGHTHANVANGGTLNAAAIAAGTLAIARGGTNIGTYAQGDILIASAADTLAKLVKGAAGKVLRMNAAGTLPEWGLPTALTPTAYLPAHVANDIIPLDIESGTIYDIPALDAGSTITLPAAAADGTYCWIRGDGTKNDQTIQVRDATGPTNLTAAIGANKRVLLFCVKVAGAWYCMNGVAP